jgi:hypothetical protein
MKEKVSVDNHEDQLIIERDTAHDLLDKFVEAIEIKFNKNFGEHTNLNNPWEDALDFLESLEK